jgi:ankyrin repeat protein
MRELLMNNDRAGIRAALEKNPNLANEGIACFDDNPAKAHPLHRLSDGVFNHLYSDEDAIEMAKILLEFGADINGGPMKEKCDTPLLAAASLHAEKLGIFFIDGGADIKHAGAHGGTALHWASWVGRDKLVKKLIEEGAAIEKLCVDFKSTPLLWAVHGYMDGGKNNRLNQVECVRLLLAAGADKTTPNLNGMRPVDFLGEEDVEMRKLLQ